MPSINAVVVLWGLGEADVGVVSEVEVEVEVDYGWYLQKETRLRLDDGGAGAGHRCACLVPVCVPIHPRFGGLGSIISAYFNSRNAKIVTPNVA